MPSPFPGMDPYLEHPERWPDVHNSLIAAVRDSLAPLLRPRYFVALEERIYVEEPRGEVFVGRPDLAVVGTGGARGDASPRARTGVVEVEIPAADRVRETYLVVRAAEDGEIVTVIEILSPANKRPGEGRHVYLEKRRRVFATLTSLVEIDLLRAGEPMPIVGERPPSDYTILVTRSWERPRADLIPFGVRDPISSFPVPLRRGEEEPVVDLGAILAALYDRAGYDLRMDYRRPPEPPLAPNDATWAAELLKSP